MWRKRPEHKKSYRQVTPFSGVGGRYAEMGKPGMVSRVSMFQVVEEDTHDNYVVCRGWDLDSDPDCEYMIERLSVAKPYAIRGTMIYKVGQVLTCAKARTILGDTPGVAEETVGDPADLDEEIGILYDDDGIVISWIIISPTTPIRIAWATTSSEVCEDDETFTVTNIIPGDGSEWKGDDPLTIKNIPPQNIEASKQGYIIYIYDEDDEFAWHPLWFPQHPCGECFNKIGDVPISEIDGYDEDVQQVLTHNTEGCLAWVSTSECEET